MYVKIWRPLLGALGDVRGWCRDVFVSDSSRADVCRTAGERVTVKVSADPNLSTTISLVHSTRQLPPSLAPLAESPASLFPRPTGLLRVLRQQRKVYLGPRRGRIGFAHRNFYCAPPFFWSAGEFSVWTRFLDRRLPTAFSLIQCEQISQTFFLLLTFFFLQYWTLRYLGFCHLSINYRT